MLWIHEKSNGQADTYGQMDTHTENLQKYIRIDINMIPRKWAMFLQQVFNSAVVIGLKLRKIFFYSAEMEVSCSTRDHLYPRASCNTVTLL